MAILLNVMRDRGQRLLVSASCMVCRIMASGDDGSFVARGAKEDEESSDEGFRGVVIGEWWDRVFGLGFGCGRGTGVGRVAKPIGDGGVTVSPVVWGNFMYISWNGVRTFKDC